MALAAVSPSMGAGRVPGARSDTGADTSLLRHSARSLAKRVALLAARAHSIRQTSTSVVLTSYQAPERGSTRCACRSHLHAMSIPPHHTSCSSLDCYLSIKWHTYEPNLMNPRLPYDENLGAATRSSVSWSR